ncbi:MAG TPA: hypothetical protein VMU27_01930 [Candidatus Paceibacterota bacterium]|nr:hypothetical protein [Candidatus Paceibacterota bacterium]
MCDYSLESLKTRKASVNDTLQVGPLGPYGTKGLHRTGEYDCATCVPPGAKLRINQGDRTRIAVFAKNDSAAMHYRDAVLFEGENTPISLQTLQVGTEVEVVELPTTGHHDREGSGILGRVSELNAASV